MGELNRLKMESAARELKMFEYLWREKEKEAALRAAFDARYVEQIRFHHARGMSRATLVTKYGKLPVVLAIGQEEKEEEKE